MPARIPGALDTPAEIRVLHVDDEPDFATLVATFLEDVDERFSIETASSVQEGQERLEAGAFDCVVSDYDMPGQTGIEFLETVREQYPELPFILYTGKGSEAVASEAISAGVTDYLQKDTGTGQYEVLANRITNAVESFHSKSALEEWTRRLETLIDNLPGMVYRCKNAPEWPMETVAGEVESLTGYTAEAIETDEVVWGEEIIHPDDQESMWGTVQTALDDNGVFEVTYRIVTADGETKWMWERGRGVYDDEGSLVALEGFISDITDRKRREQELRQANTMLSTLFETLPAGVIVEDESREVLAVNEQLFELFDLPGSPAEAVGADCAMLARQVSDLFTEDEAFVEGIVETIDQRETIHEEELLLEDGRTFARSYKPVEFADGGGHLWMYRDITERKTFEQQLKAQNERLETFVSVVSHDLRNPLEVASGYLELVREEQDSEYLQHIADAHDRMNALISELLTMAREGEGVNGVEPVDLDAISDRCWQTVETFEGTLQVQTDLTIETDRSRFRQLLGNLFRNAVEHGGEDVVVTVGELDDGFYVADDGPGIPGDEREKVFDPGYSTAEEGTGFGLSIVEQVVTAHDWEVRVTESAAGGARFEITAVDIDSDASGTDTS